VDNIVDVRVDRREERVSLRPGDERVFDLPAQRSLLRIATSAGARPSEFEPGSKDHRYLGCWIEIR
jgi:hypothetical protein